MQKLTITPQDQVFEKTTIRMTGDSSGGKFKIVFTHPTTGKSITSRAIKDNVNMWWFRDHLSRDFYINAIGMWPDVIKSKSDGVTSWEITIPKFIDTPSFSNIRVQNIDSEATFDVVLPS